MNTTNLCCASGGTCVRAGNRRTTIYNYRRTCACFAGTRAGTRASRACMVLPDGLLVAVLPDFCSLGALPSCWRYSLMATGIFFADSLDVSVCGGLGSIEAITRAKAPRGKRSDNFPGVREYGLSPNGYEEYEIYLSLHYNNSRSGKRHRQALRSGLVCCKLAECM